MAWGSSWTVPKGGSDYQRICLAFKNGDIRWNEQPFHWLLTNLDRSSGNQRTIDELAQKYVASGQPIRGQHNPPNGEHEHDVWFNICFELDGRRFFYKFAIYPEEDECPGILVLSFHYQY